MFFAKYTHWVEAAIVLYFGLAISTHFAPELQNLQNLRVISFAALLPMTLYLDIGFFVAVYPVRILTGKYNPCFANTHIRGSITYFIFILFYCFANTRICVTYQFGGRLLRIASCALFCFYDCFCCP
jgi:hypothetical protein